MLKGLLGATLLVALSACRIDITVPEGGSVQSNSGVNCTAGSVCQVDIDSTNFSMLFSAVAASGYQFEGWRAGPMQLCGGNQDACSIDMAPFAGLDGIASLIAGDDALLLEPVFSPDDSDRYPVATWRTLLEGLHGQPYRSNAFLYTSLPDTNNCDPGVLSNAAMDRFLFSVNLVRQLHYLPPISYDAFYNPEAQQSALVQLANGYLTHYPQPADTCYTAAAAAGAGSSNLSYRSGQGDPAAYPLGWVNDNNNLSLLMAAGHRRWVLHPNLTYTAYGQTAGVASMKVFGFGQASTNSAPAEVEFIAVPYKGYPFVLVSQGSRPTPWSISMVPPPGSSSAFDHFSQASVTVTETATGTPLTVHSEYYDNAGYGLRNFFSWMVDDWDYDTPYTVTISNVQMPGGAVRTVEYAVEIDYEEYL